MTIGVGAYFLWAATPLKYSSQPLQDELRLHQPCQPPFCLLWTSMRGSAPGLAPLACFLPAASAAELPSASAIDAATRIAFRVIRLLPGFVRTRSCPRQSKR